MFSLPNKTVNPLNSGTLSKVVDRSAGSLVCDPLTLPDIALHGHHQAQCWHRPGAQRDCVKWRHLITLLA